jgi:hypothetical protein
MENILAILAIGAGAFLVTFVAAVLCSERVKRQGLFGALWHEFSSSSKFRNPYRG